MKRSLLVVAAFVLLNAVGFFAYRAVYAVDAAASSLSTSRPEGADTLARDAGASQAKLKTAAEPPVAAQPTSEPDVAAPEISAQPTVTENTNSPTENVEPPARATPVERKNVKPPLRKRIDDAPVPVTKPAAIAKPAIDDKPAVESKPAVETKAADKAKDKVFEMEANPYKRGE